MKLQEIRNGMATGQFIEIKPPLRKGRLSEVVLVKDDVVQWRLDELDP